ncbi:MULTISPECIES: hypothetical protein [unclassified Streptomyces]|uniref:hypothetical protein n=1 Tax=unclassified Streptomyces TaxID=2593676 RepID=UPI0018FE6762|nr:MULTISPECIES: hypothetical protein [unclassified Streptomyces]
MGGRAAAPGPGAGPGRLPTTGARTAIRSRFARPTAACPGSAASDEHRHRPRRSRHGFRPRRRPRPAASGPGVGAATAALLGLVALDALLLGSTVLLVLTAFAASRVRRAAPKYPAYRW